MQSKTCWKLSWDHQNHWVGFGWRPILYLLSYKISRAFICSQKNMNPTPESFFVQKLSLMLPFGHAPRSTQEDYRLKKEVALEYRSNNPGCWKSEFSFLFTSRSIISLSPSDLMEETMVFPPEAFSHKDIYQKIISNFKKNPINIRWNAPWKNSW